MQKMKVALIKYKKVLIVVIILFLLLAIIVGGFVISTSQYHSNINKQKTVQETMKTNKKDENITNDQSTTQSDIETNEVKEEKNQDKESKAETSTKTDSQKSKSQSSSTSTHTNKSQTDSTSKSSHQHVWKEHTAKRWVPKMVTVADYETKTIYGGQLYTEQPDGTWLSNGETYWFYTEADRENFKNLIFDKMVNEGYIGNYVNRTKTEKVQVGSHEEDQGHYETYVDYYYCDCGARKDA